MTRKPSQLHFCLFNSPAVARWLHAGSSAWRGCTPALAAELAPGPFLSRLLGISVPAGGGVAALLSKHAVGSTRAALVHSPEAACPLMLSSEDLRSPELEAAALGYLREAGDAAGETRVFVHPAKVESVQLAARAGDTLELWVDAELPPDACLVGALRQLRTSCLSEGVAWRGAVLLQPGEAGEFPGLDAFLGMPGCTCAAAEAAT